MSTTVERASLPGRPAGKGRPAGERREVLRRGATRGAGLLGLAALLVAACAASLAYGSIAVPFDDVLDALFAYDDSDEHVVIRDLRVPRTIVALVVGLALGASGALLQGVTRNPLADPGILGINAGASLAVVAAIFVFGLTSSAAYVWFALVGGIVTTAVVYGLGASGRDGATPIKLALAGAVVGSLLGAVTYSVLVLDARTLDEFRFWVVGSVAGRDLGELTGALPVLVVGAVIAAGSGRWLNTLALGDDLARALGQRTALVRGVCFLGAVALAAAAVAAAGPLAFIGLVAPHIARGLVGPDYRWVVPYSAGLGALVLLVADILGRVVARPGELEVGIVCAVLGAPVFIALVRRRKVSDL